MQVRRKIRTRLVVSFILIMLVISPNVNAKQDFVASVREVVGPKMEGESGKVPFVSYISEGGLMAGEFFYDSNLFDKGANFTSVNLISPSTGIFTSFTQIRDYNLTDKWKLGGNLSLIKYNEINVGGVGNNSPNQEISADTLDGYQRYEGWNNRAAVNLTYELDQYNSIITEYAYEILTSQQRDYKSDTVSLAWENKELDNQKNPRQGHKIITKAKKSLNLLSHDNENDWDYTKLTFDARKYIPVFANSTLAFRFRTQSVSGTDVLDEERTALKKLYTGKPDAKVYTPAPFLIWPY